MNYIQMFANGGKTSDQELIKGIQKILGVDDAQMEQLLQIGINKYGSLEGIGQALNKATQGLTPNSSPEEVQAAIASVFQTNANSQMFKCGGKLQQLVSRFGKGGPVDCGCGCGGIKVGQEGTYLEADTPVHAAAKAARRTVSVPWPGVARRRMGAVRDNAGGLHLYEFGDINGNTTQTSIRIVPPQDTIVNQSVATKNGWITTQYPQGSDGYESIMQRVRPFVKNGVPYKQDGGIVLEDLPGHDVNTNLTRHQARQLAAQNQGYSGEQFNFAMANAKNALRNQGLRGKELRERAREMAAGISPAQRSIVEATPAIQQLPEGFGNVAKITAPTQLVLPETQTLLDSMLDQTNTTLTKRLQTNSKRTSVQKPVFVGSTPAPKKAPTPEQQARIARGQARNAASTGESSQNNSSYDIAYAYDINGNPIIGPSINASSLPILDTKAREERERAIRKERRAVNNYYNWGITKVRPELKYGNITMPHIDENGALVGKWITYTPYEYKCGGKVKSKEGIKLAKCGKKVKK